ncbi:putative F-box domain-containing protein [Medicago truncatula]|uniref:Putative F-box domain-containing protein n=1 Tax=Medicago truncatula TaxID=3880 RepID=A0A396J0M1_MEDTR|nr:putative F-box domain-containing protein [Medicago truncatula]
MAQRRSSKAAATADKISGLPEDVLCHILSLFTTKEAVATSILSKRLSHLWRYLNNIDFTDIEVYSSESNSRFNDSVYSVLVSRDTAAATGSHFINSFSLDIEYGNPHFAYHLSYPNFVKWVNLVVQRRLKHLLLHLHVGLLGP